MSPDRDKPAGGESTRDMRAWRYAGLGMELAGGIAGFAALGWWLDRSFGTSPGWLIAGSLVGSAGGLYNLIRHALRMAREDEQRRRQERHEKASDRVEPH